MSFIDIFRQRNKLYSRWGGERGFCFCWHRLFSLYSKNITLSLPSAVTCHSSSHPMLLLAYSGYVFSSLTSHWLSDLISFSHLSIQLGFSPQLLLQYSDSCLFILYSLPPYPEFLSWPSQASPLPSSFLVLSAHPANQFTVPSCGHLATTNFQAQAP